MNQSLFPVGLTAMLVDIRVSLLFAAVFLGVHSTPTPSKPLLKRDAIPSYVLTYAPYTYLYSGETYWSSDISVHLQHTTPEVYFFTQYSTEFTEMFWTG